MSRELYSATFVFFGMAILFVTGEVRSAVPVNSEADETEILRDPTAPFIVSLTQPQTNLFSLVSSYKVSSILIRPNMKVAVINSRQVREGDLLGNAEVISIDKNTVTLLVAGEEQVLELYGNSIKTLNKGEN